MSFVRTMWNLCLGGTWHVIYRLVNSILVLKDFGRKAWKNTFNICCIGCSLHCAERHPKANAVQKLYVNMGCIRSEMNLK